MMSKFILCFLFSIVLGNAYADQQEILSKEEAEKTVAFLETQAEVVIYCGCCSNVPHQKVIILSVSYECSSENWCIVRVQGIDMLTQEEVNQIIDLAYTWVNVEGVAKNLAWEVGLNANPCASEFDWDTYEIIEEVVEVTFDKKDAKAFRSSFKKMQKLLSSEVGFTLETFESNEQFVVDNVKLEYMSEIRSIVISHIGKIIEQRYTIPLDKIKSLSKNEAGIEFETLEDGTVTIEEFQNSENKYRSFYFVRTVPIPNVEMAHLKHFTIITKTYRSSVKW